MNDTNFVSVIVKILESPKKELIGDNIPFSMIRVQLPSISKKKDSVIFLRSLGNLVETLLKYYSVNEYIIVEAY